MDRGFDRQPAKGWRPRPRGWHLRLCLWGLTAEMFVIGGPAATAPGWFFTDFPFGRGWVASAGPYNEHVIRDLGAAYLAFGVVLAWAAIRPDAQLARAATLGAVAANVPHLMFHLMHTAQLPTVDLVAQGASLAISTVVAVGAFGLTLLRPELAVGVDPPRSEGSSRRPA